MSSGRYHVDRDPSWSLSTEVSPKKSLNNLSMAVCRLASSPTGLQREIAILQTSYSRPLGARNSVVGVGITTQDSSLNTGFPLARQPPIVHKKGERQAHADPALTFRSTCLLAGLL